VSQVSKDKMLFLFPQNQHKSSREKRETKMQNTVKETRNYITIKTMLKMTKDVINSAAFTSQCSCGSALSADKSRATPSWARPVQHFTTKHRML